MTVTFSKPDFIGKDYVGFKILNEAGDIVGEAEGAGNKYGEFVSVIKIYNPSYLGYGIGFDAFKTAFDLIDTNFPISTIKTSWNKDGEFKDYENGMSTNLLLFLRNQKTMDEIQSAKNTPTGKWCTKLGFTMCEIKSNTPECVETIFTKP
jgi:hypothetical protein